MEVNTPCVRPAWIFALVNRTERRRRRWKSLVRPSPRRFGGPSSSCHLSIAKEPVTRNLRTLDPSLTLTRTQYPAMVGNLENSKAFNYAGFAGLCTAQQPVTAHA